MKKIKFILSTLVLFLLISIGVNAEILDVKIGKSYAKDETVTISSKSNFKILIDEKLIAKSNSKILKVKFNGTDIDLLDGENTLVKSFPTSGIMLISSDSPISIGKRSYRGNISFRINNSKLDIINNIELEDYLKGVVPKELSASYPKEALKAQAIVSRSFAMANLNKYKKLGYDLNDTTSCQVYQGFSAEEEKSNKAVDYTKGMMIYFDNNVINAIFGASSGGFVADVSDVWGGKKIPYLTAFEDPYSKYEWNFEVKNEDLNNYLGREVNSLEIKDLDSSGRVKKLILNGIDEITASELRNKLGNSKFKSTNFTIEKTDLGFIFNGKGYGHGVGFSQYGAVEMAKLGFKTEDILKFYFKGTEVR